jgi:hypothetical protein
MPKRRTPIQKPEKALDAFSEKRGRGRPQKIQRTWVTGRAKNYRQMLSQVWPELAGPLLAAETEEQIIAAFEKHGQPYAGEFVPRLATEILALIHASNFPMRPKARIGFLADSLGGMPTIAARTARDICAKHRANERVKSPHKIIRHEFYVECECGYKGPARDNACRKCGAEISMLPEAIWGNPSFFR